MLPNLSELTTLDLLRLTDHPEVKAHMIILKRIMEGKPVNASLTAADEVLWLAHSSLGKLLQMALEELEPSDILNLWAKKKPRKQKRGRPPEDINAIAWVVINSTGKEKMEVYYDFVQPILIATGRIMVDDNGDPDPYQDMIEQKNYLKALSRMKNHPPDSP